jgi:hypothetical protein
MRCEAALGLEAEPATAESAAMASGRASRGAVQIPVIRPNAAELAAHEKALEAIERAGNGPALFRR